MNTHADKVSETKSEANANGSPKLQRNDRVAFQLADNRPEAAALTKLQELANNSPQVSRLMSLQQLANNSHQAKQVAQLQALANAKVSSPIQLRIANGIAQLAQAPDEEELIQGIFETVQRQPNESERKPRENNTGLPDNIKAGIESLSGLSLDHVRVHYNSAQPAQLNALAYAQGSDIHVAPGQEQHLPHEAWHVVQQAQGRVQPTMQIKDGVPVNDDAGLEREADVMGAKASIAVNMVGPSGIFQRQAESAEAHPQLEPVSGQGEKGPLNFLSSARRLSALQRTADAFAASRTPPVQRLTADGTDYTPQEIGAAAAYASENVTKKKAKDTDFASAMADHLLEIGQATNYKNRAQLEKACKNWFNKPSSYGVAAEPEAREKLDEPTIEYEAEHGDRHFINKPIRTKAAWTIEKGIALVLMEAAIREHLKALGENSATGESRDGWSTFYITVDHGAKTGVYWVEKSERIKNQFPTTNFFTIQLQVNYATNMISYHGYPDQSMKGRPTGCSKTKGGALL